MFPRKGTVATYKEILDMYVLPILWQQFVEGPFVFQYICALVHKARYIKTGFDRFGMRELKWSVAP